ncbi:MAG TPA: 6,7-dimethyl-8-ribityllumazine synthase [Fimbriimonadaceae bacterium]|nr:6,7-dimethyl-8-ribityllumazine synthase [Fimbriimonadaceae bacterium]
MDVRRLKATMDSNGRRFAIVVSRWNEIVTKELTEGALDELERYGAPRVDVIHVPGTWEIPPTIKKLLASEDRPEAIIALGCILQGQTAHAQLLGADVGSALMALQVESEIPIAWGILTPEKLEQAFDRAGAKLGNKGREAAQAALEMAGLLEKL